MGMSRNNNALGRQLVAPLAAMAAAPTTGRGKSMTTAALSSFLCRAVAATMLVLLLSLAAATGMIDESHAQAMASHIVINELDLNPPGNDAASISEWVEMYNPTDQPVDIGGWQIASTATFAKKTMLIAEGTVINPGQFVTYAYQASWFADVGESVELRDASGMVVDKTPRLTDFAGDSTSWQRYYDGYDSDSDTDWKLAFPTPGTSNGKIVTGGAVDKLIVTLDSDKESYAFGEVATISGSVSELVFVEKPYFEAESINMTIAGPSYRESITLYPDHGLRFLTSLDLKQQLGVGVGTYTATAIYAGASAQTTFQVGVVQVVEAVEEEELPLTIGTDKSAYIPGETVTIRGAAPETVQLATVKYSVMDPSGAVVSEGNSVPIGGLFEITMLVDMVNPAYGTYLVAAEYAEKIATATFDVTVDVREDARISVDTDKAAYALGDTVTVSGRLNQVWIAVLDLEVVQTGQDSLSGSSVGVYSEFKITEALDVAGDGSFEYAFVVPDDPIRLGDYRITVKGDVGSVSLALRVVEDPDLFADVADAPITIRTDSQSYVQNEPVTFSGFVGAISSDAAARYATTPVLITITDEHGKTIASSASADDIRRDFAENEGVVDYQLTAIPDESGSYTATTVTYPSVFASGTYVATAKYLGSSASTVFSVMDQSYAGEASIRTDRDVYGLGQTVTLTGVFPPTGINHVLITLTKPDGTKINSGATVENQHFSWTWDAPAADRVHSIREGELRGIKMSVFGVYKITVSTDTNTHYTFFKISENPDDDSLAKVPIFVMPSQSMYNPGDKLTVLGNVMLYDAGGEGLRVPPRVTITVQQDSFPYQKIYESKVYPDNGGAFSSMFALPVSVFEDGPYRITAVYNAHQATAYFGMANNYVYNIDDPIRLIVQTDKDTYKPGQTVNIGGGPNQIIFVDKYDVSVAKKTGEEIKCISYLCGAHTGPVTRILPDSMASFTHQFEIPQGSDAVGTYEVTIESNFAIEHITFEVEEKFVPFIFIEKQSRLPGSEFVLTTANKTVGDGGMQNAIPISVSGSVFTMPGEEHSVNLFVTTGLGTCLIGQSDGCLIRHTTGQQGSSYATVNLDGSDLRVVYNGPGERLEKFYIYPGAGSERLPDATWNVNVVKDDQISRFYHKIAYKTVDLQ